MTERTKGSTGELASSVARGGTVTIAGQGARVLLQLTGLVVLARLLDPSDFGLIAMVTAIIGVADVLRDFGLTAAIVQTEDITQSQLSRVFWINLTIGFTVSVGLFLASGAISNFYGDPAIVPIVQLLSVVFLFNAASGQFRAIMMRELKLTQLALAEIVSQAFGLSVAIAVAAVTGSFWALPLQQLSVALSLLAIVFKLSGWIPTSPFAKGPPVRPLIKYGVFYTLTQLAVYTSSNISSIVLGRTFDPSVLGYYNRAYYAATLPVNQISQPASSVALSTLSRVRRDPEVFAKYMVHGQKVLTYPLVGALTILVVYADWLVEFTFGAKWLPMVPILQALAVGSAVQLMTFTSFWVFLSTARTQSNFVFTLITRTIMTVAIWYFSRYGALPAAIAATSSVVLIWPLSLIWVARFVGISMWEPFWAGCRTLTFWTVVGVVLVAANYELGGPPAVLTGLGLSAVIAVLLVSIPGPFKRDYRSLTKTVSLVVGPRLLHSFSKERRSDSVVR